MTLLSDFKQVVFSVLGFFVHKPSTGAKQNWSVRRLRQFLAVLVFAILPRIALAQKSGNTNQHEFSFGFEFTFTNEHIRAARLNSVAMHGSYQYLEAHEEYIAVWHSYFMALTEEITKSFNKLFPHNSSRLIETDRGFRGWVRAHDLDVTRLRLFNLADYNLNFLFGHDDGVIEVRSLNGHSLKNLRELTQLMNHLVFGSAQNAGVRPYTENGAGGGHINIGIKPMARHPSGGLWLANVLISLINEYELYHGILIQPDWRNARPYQARLLPDDWQINPAYQNLVTKSNWNQVLSFIAKVRDLGPNPSFQDVWDLASSTMHFGRPHGSVSNYEDDRPVVVRGLGEQRRIEIRGVAPQRDFSHFLDQAELFETHINSLEGLQELIEARPAEIELTPDLALPVETLMQSFRRVSAHMDPVAAARILPGHLRTLFKQTLPGPPQQSPAPYCGSLIRRIKSLLR